VTRPRLAALIVVAIGTAWYLNDAINKGGVLWATATVVAFTAAGILVVEHLERRS
jgi:hypothetical protein